MDKLKILNAWHIKLLMVTIMVLDHLRHIDNFISPEIGFYFNLISRCVAPMFAFLVVEGLIHTSNLKKYLNRLFLFAAITFFGSSLLTMILGNQWLLRTNVLFALSLGAFGIVLVTWGKEQNKRSLYVLATICFIVGFLFGEWGTVLIPFMAATYFFRDKPIYKYTGYIITVVIAFFIPFSEPYWFIVFPLLFMYNGKRGYNTVFSKYFFYIFYPVHLWILAVINYFM